MAAGGRLPQGLGSAHSRTRPSIGRSRLRHGSACRRNACPSRAASSRSGCARPVFARLRFFGTAPPCSPRDSPARCVALCLRTESLSTSAHVLPRYGPEAPTCWRRRTAGCALRRSCWRRTPGRPACRCHGQVDEFRQLRRPHRAGAGAARSDRLDGWGVDLGRPHVPALLPHHERRAGGHGERLGADRARRKGRSALLRGRGHRGACRARASQALARPSRRESHPRLGRADRRVPGSSALLRHRGRPSDPLRRRLLGQWRRGKLARRPDPGLARDGPLGRVDKPRARLENGAGAAARADQAARRGACPRCDSHAGGARGGRPSRAALRARRGRAAPAYRG